MHRMLQNHWRIVVFMIRCVYYKINISDQHAHGRGTSTIGCICMSPMVYSEYVGISYFEVQYSNGFGSCRPVLRIPTQNTTLSGGVDFGMMHPARACQRTLQVFFQPLSLFIHVCSS
jgi:hypothetical protein